MTKTTSSYKVNKSFYAQSHSHKQDYFRGNVHNSKTKKRSHNKNIPKNHEYSFNLDHFSHVEYSNTVHKKSKLKLRLDSSSIENLLKEQEQKPKPIVKKDHKKFKLSEFIVLSLLGYGTFGSVLLVKYQNEPMPYALKVVK